MNTKVMKCPNCGANVDFDDEQDVAYCKYCGTKVIREKPSVQRIHIENPVQIDGKVELVNHEFESKLAQLSNTADIFFDKPSPYNYTLVWEAYNQAEQIGTQESRLYTFMLDFFVKANLEYENYNKKTRPWWAGRPLFAGSDKQFEKTYDKLTKLAVKYEKNLDKKRKLEKQYQEQKNIIINKYKSIIEEQAKISKKVFWPTLIGALSFSIILALIITIIALNI